jgi:hypothetical protein
MPSVCMLITIWTVKQKCQNSILLKPLFEISTKCVQVYFLSYSKSSPFPNTTAWMCSEVQG